MESKRIFSNEDLPYLLLQEKDREVEIAKLVSDQWLDQQTQVEFVQPNWLVEFGTKKMFAEHFGWEGIVFDDDLADLGQAEIDLLGLNTVYDGKELTP